MNSETLEFFQKIGSRTTADISNIIPWPDNSAVTYVSPHATFRLGEDLQSLLDELRACGSDLLELTRPPLNQRIKGHIERLHAGATRIAVVGQIKAGKSSFINAIIGRPDYLPTHVNPWTAVPTKLYFGLAKRPRSGAYFEFFDTEEWHRLGRTAPVGLNGHDRSSPSEAEKEMWRRAVLRIGHQFQQLLGKAHRYDKITPKELAHYLCAGPPILQPSRHIQPGRYADITRVAHIYLPAEPFAAPAVLIDTPGLNDPSVIRIKTTHNILEQADIYVVVLSASQPMSLADVTLLRQLRGLEKRRLLIFINRADELPGGRADVEAVEAHVREKLAAEFPEASAPIISGSALWANAAIGGTEGQVRDILASDLYQSRLGGLGAGFGSTRANLDDQRAELLAASGMRAVMNAISGLMLSSFLSSDGLSFAEMLRSAAEFCSSTAARELAALQRMIVQNPGAAEPISFDEALANLDRRLKEVEAVGRNAAAIVEDTVREIEDAQAEQIKRIRAHLEALARSFAGSQRQQSLESFREQSIRHWRCDTTALVRQLETEFMRLFASALRDIEDIQKHCIGTVRAYLAHSQLPEEEDAVAKPECSRQPDIRGALPALGKTIAVHIGRPWWASWWRSEETPEERAGELVARILGEFLPVADGLSRLAAKELAAFGEQAGSTLSDAVQSAIAGTKARLIDLKERLTQHIEQGQMRRLELLDADYARSYRELTSLKSGCEAVIDRLQRIEARQVL